MNFKDWCLQEFGILDFTEGKIQNNVFIPAQPSMCINYIGIAQIGGSVINSLFLQGMIIPFNIYRQLKQKMYEFFRQRYGEDPNGFRQWSNGFFTKLGLNATQEKEYKEPSAIHITFRGLEEQNSFLNKFQSYNPIFSFNVLSQKHSLQLPAHFISHLKQLYYQSPHAEINNPQLTSLMINQMKNLQTLLGIIEKNNLRVRLDYANFLSKDLSNTSNYGSDLYDEQAASVYAISLRVYAEINRDNLSEYEYKNFNYAASILAAYDEMGNLKQSLKKDSKFLDHIVRLYHSSKAKHVNSSTLSDLPVQEQGHILSLIKQNTATMLFGDDSTPRFLPDSQMHSETDEMVFQGGGVATHSAIFRIIKVGILQNGQKAGPYDKPLFYEYYKIEDNLGDGCHEIDLVNKTCMGTYITKLSPFIMKAGQLVPLDINPYLQPQAYQQAMIGTLSELISVERQLIFYPEFDLNNNSTGPNNEEKEWLRLKELQRVLSGQPYPFPLVYYTQDPLDPSKRYQRSVFNQRNFFQEGGSCPIFSLKSLIASIIGLELTTLHNNFMQLHNGELHLFMIREKMNKLQFQITQFLRPPRPTQSPLQNQIAFFGRNLRGIDLLRNSSLQGAQWINSITIAIDPQDAAKRIFKFRCSDPKMCYIVANSIASTVPYLKVLVKGKELILDEEQVKSLCTKLNIVYDTFLNSLPFEGENYSSTLSL
ncbi:hypothetical protein [Legionella maioricensis]|uniref:Uncharacterized protein n=1 Tax=Legionella maioricensis TaxID=2896528 RepID=A0A9X2ICB6_9GAMM|nr:hypothetical protein [Legionella maioricensis]MCL9683588.1 hypothetical protein [Legionella maioricensis]MCL9686887.1 hypothetical protein [Legionella maioricensis]